MSFMEELDGRAFVDTRLNDKSYNNAHNCHAHNLHAHNLHAPRDHPTNSSLPFSEDSLP